MKRDPPETGGERNQVRNSLMHYTHHPSPGWFQTGAVFIFLYNLMAIRIVAEKGFSAGVMLAERPFSVAFLTKYKLGRNRKKRGKAGKIYCFFLYINIIKSIELINFLATPLKK